MVPTHSEGTITGPILGALTPEALRLLRSEFLALHDLVNPNLVNLGELIDEGGLAYFTMELVDGVPIRKTAAWWWLAQDERREIFEGRSRHIADAMAYLPRVARRLYHARDLGEPFDFLTWFEFAPEHAAAFDELVAMLRSRDEWRWVEREVEIRLARD